MHQIPKLLLRGKASVLKNHGFWHDETTAFCGVHFEHCAKQMKRWLQVEFSGSFCGGRNYRFDLERQLGQQRIMAMREKSPRHVHQDESVSGTENSRELMMFSAHHSVRPSFDLNS